MSLDWYQDVCDFMKKFGQEVKTKPSSPSLKVRQLRAKLILEEYFELMEKGLGVNPFSPEEDDGKVDLEELADGACDLIVVVLGTLAAFGIDPRPVWDEIHKSNMAKEGGGKRGDGKVMKPKGWTAPDVKKLLVEQGMKG